MGTCGKRTAGLAAFFAAACLFGLLRPALGADAAATAPPAPSKPGAKYTLRYKFKPGEVVRSDVVHQVNLTTTISGTTQVAETTSGSVKAWRITNVEPDGRVTFEHSVERVDMRQKVSGRQEVAYDSAKDKEPPPAFAAVSGSIGVPLTVVTIDPSGKILKRVDRRPGGAPADAQNNQMVVPLPDGPVAVGENWHVPVDVTIALEDGVTKVIKTRQHYTLEKVANGVATISVATQVLTPGNNPKVQSQLIQRLTKGTIRFDIDTGRVLDQKLDLDEQVLGFDGPESSLHYLGRFRERLLPAEAKTASQSAKSAK